MSYNASPFMELIEKEIEKFGAFEDSTEKKKELAQSIDDKLFTIMKIVVNDDQVKKLKDFEGYHSYFVFSMLDAIGHLEKREQVDLLFSITKGVLCLSVLFMCAPSEEVDYAKVMNLYNKKIARLKRHINYCVTLAEIEEGLKKEGERETKVSKEMICNHLDKILNED